MEVDGFLETAEVERLKIYLAKCLTSEVKEEMLRLAFPVVYGALLRSMDRTNEVFDGKITPQNYTWYIFIELIPMLDKLRQNGKLK